MAVQNRGDNRGTGPAGNDPNYNTPPDPFPFYAPPTALATNPQVMAAYRKLMSYAANQDVLKGDLKRNLATNLEGSRKNRVASLLNNRQTLADRGMLNSGVALKRQEDLNTQYDSTDNSLQQNYDTSLGDIVKTLQGLNDNYQDTQVSASAEYTQQQVAAQEAAAAAQRQADQQKAQYDSLVALMQGSPANNPIAAPGVPAPVKKAVVPKKVVAAAPVIKSPIAKLYRSGVS